MDIHRLRILDSHYRRSVTTRIQRKKHLISQINKMCDALADMREELNEMIAAERTEFRRFEVGFSNDHVLIEDDGITNIPVATRVQPTAPPYEEATCSAGGTSNDTSNGTVEVMAQRASRTRETVKLEEDGCNDSISHSGDSHSTLDLMEDDDEFFDCVDIINVKSTRFKKNDKVVITGGTRYGCSEICTVISVTTHKVKVMDRDGISFHKNKEHVQKVVLLSKNPRPNWLVD